MLIGNHETTTLIQHSPGFGAPNKPQGRAAGIIHLCPYQRWGWLLEDISPTVHTTLDCTAAGGHSLH